MHDVSLCPRTTEQKYTIPLPLAAHSETPTLVDHINLHIISLTHHSSRWPPRWPHPRALKPLVGHVLSSLAAYHHAADNAGHWHFCNLLYHAWTRSGSTPAAKCWPSPVPPRAPLKWKRENSRIASPKRKKEKKPFDILHLPISTCCRGTSICSTEQHLRPRACAFNNMWQCNAHCATIEELLSAP